MSWILAALALIVATFFIAHWRPIFGGSGFGLVVEEVSCAAAIAVAVMVTLTNLGYLRGRRWGLRNHVFFSVVIVVVAVGTALDAIAACIATFRR